MLTETGLSKVIREHLEWKNWPVYRMNAGTWIDARSGKYIHGQDRGCPDLLVGYFHPQHRVWLMAWIEVKTGSNLSTEQIAFIRKLNLKGQPWLVARSVDDVEKWMLDINYHGEPRDVQQVLDESQRFIPTQVKKTKKQRMSMMTAREFNTWSDKYTSAPPF